MNNLLEKVGSLRYKYSLLKNESSFNLFEILRKTDDEVHLHSRFIAELLDVKGAHKLGDTFLRLFIDCLDLKDSGYGNCMESKVAYEKYIGEINESKTEGGRIDIIIEKIGNFPIIIENKIHADDQDNQLLRYYNYNKQAKLFYLTLHGDEPSEKSLGGMNSELVQLLSYKSDISGWLTKCIEKTAKHPGLREAIVQYQNLISDLTGSSTSMEERLELIQLLSINDNILSAQKIAENWVHVKWHTEFDFWNCFQRIIEENSAYKVLDRQKFSNKLLDVVIHKSRNRNPWYGLTIKIGNYKDTVLYLMVERGFDDLYYGIKGGDKEMMSEIANAISSLDMSNSSHHWAGVKYFDPKINFESFSNKTTLALCNPEKREQKVSEMWNEMKSFISDCKSILNI